MARGYSPSWTHSYRGPDYNERNRERGILRYDVGIDANEYCPVSRDDILAFFDGVEPKPAQLA